MARPCRRRRATIRSAGLRSRWRIRGGSHFFVCRSRSVGGEHDDQLPASTPILGSRWSVPASCSALLARAMSADLPKRAAGAGVAAAGQRSPRRWRPPCCAGTVIGTSGGSGAVAGSQSASSTRSCSHCLHADVGALQRGRCGYLGSAMHGHRGGRGAAARRGLIADTRFACSVARTRGGLPGSRGFAHLAWRSPPLRTGAAEPGLPHELGSA